MSDPIRLSHTQCNAERTSVRIQGGQFAIAVGETGIKSDIARGFAHLTREESRLQTHDGIGWLMARVPAPPEPEPQAAPEATPEPEPQAAPEATPEPEPPKASKSKKSKSDDPPATDA